MENDKIRQKPVKSDKVPQGGDRSNQRNTRITGRKVKKVVLFGLSGLILTAIDCFSMIKFDKIRQNTTKYDSLPQAGDPIWAN